MCKLFSLTFVLNDLWDTNVLDPSGRFLFGYCSIWCHNPWDSELARLRWPHMKTWDRKMLNRFKIEDFRRFSEQIRRKKIGNCSEFIAVVCTLFKYCSCKTRRVPSYVFYTLKHKMKWPHKSRNTILLLVTWPDLFKFRSASCLSRTGKR